MKLNKPKFWNKENSFFSFFFIPFTFVVLIIIYLKKKFTKKINFNIPIICIGNIYVGGTGKTPSAIKIAEELALHGKNPTIIRKFYKEHKDEHFLIKKKFKNLILTKDRINGINKAIKQNFDSVILDDGFQDYKIAKDISILCFNQKQLVGNGFVFPSGPLRESLNALKHAHIILINGRKDIHFEKRILTINKNLSIFYSNYNPINLNEFKNKKLLAFAGIGNPENFFDLLSKKGLNVEKTFSFPDHYQFNDSEILKILKIARDNKFQIITTEKDYLRIKNLYLNEIKYIRLSLEIESKKKFLEKILSLYDKNN